jgi:hypothetical protein
MMIKIFTIYLTITLAFLQCSQKNDNVQNNNSGNLNQNNSPEISAYNYNVTEADLLGIWKGTEANDTELWYLNFKENNEFEDLYCGDKKGIRTFRYELYRENGKVTIKLSNVDLPLHPEIYNSKKLKFSLPILSPDKYPMDKKINTILNMYRFERAEKMDCNETNRNY